MEQVVETIEKDGFDRLSWDDISSKVETFRQEEAQKNSLLGDVFTSFYKMDPKLTEGNTPWHKLISDCINTQQYQDLRTHTQLDDIGSAIATKALGETLLNAAQEIEDAEKEQREPDYNAMRRGFRRSAEQAQKDCEDAEASIGVLAGNDPGSWQRLPFEDRLGLVEKLTGNKTFQKIAELFGRFRNLAQGLLAHNATHGYDEIHDICNGSDLGRILPSELIRNDPELGEFAEFCWFRDFCNSNLLSYELKGNSQKGKGPVVCCLDISGSMREYVDRENQKEAWAKAICLALALIAEKQKRPFSLVLFNSRVRKTNRYEKLQLKDKIELLSVCCEGGTNFDEPLTAACELIRNDNNLKPADIVFITDGEASLSISSEINQTKKDTGTRICGIGIGASLAALGSILDLTIETNNLESLDVVEKTFRSVIA